MQIKHNTESSFKDILVLICIEQPSVLRDLSGVYLESVCLCILDNNKKIFKNCKNQLFLSKLFADALSECQAILISGILEALS